MIALTKLCTKLQSLGLGLFENVSFKSQKALCLVTDTELKIACVHISAVWKKKSIYKALKVLTEIHSSERAKQKHAALWDCPTLSFAKVLRLVYSCDGWYHFVELFVCWGGSGQAGKHHTAHSCQRDGEQSQKGKMRKSVAWLV